MAPPTWGSLEMETTGETGALEEGESSSETGDLDEADPTGETGALEEKAEPERPR